MSFTIFSRAISLTSALTIRQLNALTWLTMLVLLARWNLDVLGCLLVVHLALLEKDIQRAVVKDHNELVRILAFLNGLKPLHHDNFPLLPDPVQVVELHHIAMVNQERIVNIAHSSLASQQQFDLGLILYPKLLLLYQFVDSHAFPTFLGLLGLSLLRLAQERRKIVAHWSEFAHIDRFWSDVVFVPVVDHHLVMGSGED